MEINIYQHIRNEQETQPAAVAAAVIGGRKLSHVQGNNTLQRSGNIVFVGGGFFHQNFEDKAGSRPQAQQWATRQRGGRGKRCPPRDSVRTPGTRRRESGEPEHEKAEKRRMLLLRIHSPLQGQQK